MPGTCELAPAAQDVLGDLGAEAGTALLGDVVGPALALLVQAGALAAAGQLAASEGLAVVASPEGEGDQGLTAGLVSPRMAAELALVEAAERVKAWADAQQIAALGRLHAASVEACRQLTVASGRSDRAELATMVLRGCGRLKDLES